MNLNVTVRFPEAEKLVSVLMSIAGRLAHLEQQMETMMALDQQLLDLITSLNDRTNAMSASIDTVIATEGSIQTSVSVIAQETQDISARIDALIAQINAGMTPAEVEQVKAQLTALSAAADAVGTKLTDQVVTPLGNTSASLQAESEALQALGQDPANPVPPPATPES